MHFNLIWTLTNNHKPTTMKKTLLIALCSLAVMFAACTKPEPEPEPETVDYAPNYVGNYIGQFLFSDIKMVSNGQTQTGFSFHIDNIGMDLTKGEGTNAITAMVTVGNESHYTNGTTSAEKADFGTVHLVIDESHQISNPYVFNLDLLMEGTKAASDTLLITGTFTGDGTFTINGVENDLTEVSGNLTGKLVKQ